MFINDPFSSGYDPTYPAGAFDIGIDEELQESKEPLDFTGSTEGTR